MAIININSLDEKTTALTDSDMLVLGTQSGAMKIKANSLGGGGGSSDFVVNFTVTIGAGGPEVTADKTYSEVAAAFPDENIKGIAEDIPNVGSLCFYLAQITSSSVVFFTYMNNMYVKMTGDSSGWSMTINQ